MNITGFPEGASFSAGAIADGKAAIAVSGLKAGESYALTVKYEGDSNYNDVEKSNVSLTIEKADNAIAPTPASVAPGSTVLKLTGLPADATGNLTAVINGQTYKGTSQDGINIV